MSEMIALKRRDFFRAATFGGVGLGLSNLYPAWAQPLSGGSSGR
ncbi:MAG: twin-arginine translocation signal domain-containing protein [Sphingomonas sp.]|nr:twin-arginine translocation signal domain-containing protein [Sphingomonas sp.]